MGPRLRGDDELMRAQLALALDHFGGEFQIRFAAEHFKSYTSTGLP